MRLKRLNTIATEESAIEIRSSEVTFSSLMRILRAVPGVLIKSKKNNIVKDTQDAKIEFKGYKFAVKTPMSDYIIYTVGPCPEYVWNEFVSACENRPVRWWERVI